MFYIYVLLLCNNTILIVSSDLSINKIQNLPDFMEIKEIIKENDDKKALSGMFDKIIKKYKKNSEKNSEKNVVEVLDNLELDDFIIVDALYSENISSLEKEIGTLNDIRQHMLILENSIKKTDINLNNLLQGQNYDDENMNVKDYSIANFINDRAKFENAKLLLKTITQEQLRLYHREQRIGNSLSKNIKIKELLEITSSSSDISRIIINVERIISALYSSYLSESKIKLKYYEPDSVLQAYTVKYYNNKLRKELKELEEKYGTMKTIINKLTFAYSKILEL